MQHMTTSTNEDQSLLVQTRFLKILGSLDPQFFLKTKALQYIYDSITVTPLKRVLECRPLEESEKLILRTAHLHAQSQLA